MLPPTRRPRPAGRKIIALTGAPDARLVINFTGGLTAAFTTVVLLTSFTVTIPYLLSAANQLLWVVPRRRPATRLWDLTVAALAAGRFPLVLALA